MSALGKAVGILLLVVVVFVGLDYALGWNQVFYTSTVEKAQQNAEREVFEETQSYVEGKRQEASKYFLEYRRAEDEVEKKAIAATVRNSFANFEEEKLNSPELENFVYNCKYKY